MVNSEKIFFGLYSLSRRVCQGELRQSRKRRCPGVRPRHTVCKFICADFTVGGGHRPPTLSLNGCWEATGLPYGITSANDLLHHYADCILCDMLRRGGPMCPPFPKQTADWNPCRRLTGRTRWCAPTMACAGGLHCRTTCSSLRIGRVPAFRSFE